jgi:nucleotide sugar dehydrogenase
MNDPRPLIGCIGQGYVGKNYADDLEDRGYEVVRYALEEPYAQNKERIAECDIVFIGVPTPTTPEGFNDAIVRDAVSYVGAGKIAVLKSTVVPGTTVYIQEQYPDRTVFYSPEFLSEATAREDVSNPFASIVGMTKPESQKQEAEAVLAILPPAPFSRVMTSTEAEIFKYAHNTSGYIQVVFFNLLYDLARSMDVAWENIGDAIAADPYISNRYSNPIHKSGRGAGGHCFIKDFAALRDLYAAQHPTDTLGIAFMDATARKNVDLLRASGKDSDLLRGVYGEASLTEGI